MTIPHSKIITELLNATPSIHQDAVKLALGDPLKERWLKACDSFLTTDPDTIKVKLKAFKLAPLDHCVLIRGESGTGKELIAQILHGERKGEFVAVNSTAFTDTLFESELFGHTRGSFTGALADRYGLIKQAANGTLFLDEIGDMPPHLQAKLLRIIQTRKYRMVGSDRELPVECRIVAATHQPIEQLITNGQFRLDLYHRLATIELKIKPLRDRVGDIKLFTTNNELLAEINVSKLTGNVRELLNMKVRWEIFSEL